MLRERIQATNYSFFDKLKSIDYLLILLMVVTAFPVGFFILGLVSIELLIENIKEFSKVD